MIQDDVPRSTECVLLSQLPDVFSGGLRAIPLVSGKILMVAIGRLSAYDHPATIIIGARFRQMPQVVHRMWWGGVRAAAWKPVSNV